MLPEKEQKIAQICANEPLDRTDQGQWVFVSDLQTESTAGAGLQGWLQDRLKSFSGLYYWLIEVVSPVRASRRFRRGHKAFLQQYSANDVVVNFGSGPRRLAQREDIINLDVFGFDEVDVVVDGAIPFQDNSVDGLISIAVVEHLQKPHDVVAEFHRVLKPGGQFFVFIPFMQPIHAAPHDYNRWTPMGLEEVFRSFENVEVAVGAGPTSGMLWIVQEWLAMVLSLGIKPLRDVWFIVLMAATFWVKYLDDILEYFSGAETLASGYLIVGKKGVSEDSSNASR